MKVILTARLNKLGTIGDIVAVKDGYARNYLIPKGYAINYTPSNYKMYEEKKQEIAEANKARVAEALDLKESLGKKKLVIIEKAGDDGKLYGSINTARLAQELNNLMGKAVLRKGDVTTEETIKNIGAYVVTLQPHPEVSFGVKLIVARSQEEAKSIEKGKKVVKEEKKEENEEE